DADARRGMNLQARDAHRCLHRLDYPERNCLHRIAFRTLRDDQYELVPPKTGDGVDLAHDALETACHLLQQFIADTMSKGVVHQLESIEIEQDHGKRLALTVGQRHALADAIIHQYTVWQAREGIVCRQVAQLLVGGLQALRACSDHLLESLHLVAHDALVLPLSSQRVGALHDLDGLEWLFYHEQLVGVIKASHD